MPPHGKFSIGNGRKGWVLGGMMTEARTWSGSWSFSIGDKFADLVGFTRAMRPAATHLPFQIFLLTMG